MRLLWPWALVTLVPVAVAAFWALRRPLHQVVPVGSLRLWERALAALGPAAAKRARRVSAAWVCLLCGAVAAGVALSRPTYSAGAPARRIAVAVYPSAELAGAPEALGEPLASFLRRLDPRDRVRLILPAALGGASGLLTAEEAARRLREVRCLPVPTEQLVLPGGEGEVQHLYRFAPAVLGLEDGPETTTISLSARPGDLTIDAFAVAPLPGPAGEVELFVAMRNHTAGRRQGKLALRRDEGSPVEVEYDLGPRQRGAVLAKLPAGGNSYAASIAGASGPGAKAFVVRRSSAVRQVALVGRDDPHVRRFVRVHRGLRLVGDAAEADAVIAVDASAPEGKPALIIHPPVPPPGWKTGSDLAAIALRDADVLADHPLLAQVHLSAVAVRRVTGWQPLAAPSQQRLLSVGADALLLVAVGPPRVYLAFDLAPENTSFAMDTPFVIFMANVMKYLVPDARAEVGYEHVAPVRAGPRPDWQPLGTAAGAAGAGPLPWPGLYRDEAGTLHAVSLTGLRSAEPQRDPARQIAELRLPPPVYHAGRTELWPILACLAGLLWLAGWTIRLR